MFPITEILLAGSVTGGVVLGTTGLLILHAGAAKREQDCDYIIVLGSKLEGGTPTATLLERIARAATYLNAHPRTKAILSGGEGEAACMFAALTAAGIDENRLTLEEKSTSTWQNLKFSLPLVEPEETVGILSSDFHLFRAKMYLKFRKVPIIPAKTQNFPRWLRNFIREIAGVWHYILLGGTYD
jgi:uncharacterized SAM-binding protein YcdF (DUF218 family)